jgi:hypothetical protein
MKKVFSIFFTILTVIAMLHLSIAVHYCGGKFAASKVSLSGRLATCRMENCDNESTSEGNNLKSDCCNDLIFYYGSDNNYDPSFSFVPEFYQYNTQVFNIPVSLPIISVYSLKTLYTNVNPPGISGSTNVDLSDICVFRI